MRVSAAVCAASVALFGAAVPCTAGGGVAVNVGNFGEVPCTDIPERFCIANRFGGESDESGDDPHWKYHPGYYQRQHRRRKREGDAEGSDEEVVGDTMPMDSGVEYVRQLLQTAIEVEHSTIPLYMSAYWSIISNSTSPDDPNFWAGNTIHGVVIEEMLHMTTACNVLNAIGGAPAIDTPDFIPDYPMVLPFVNVSGSIQPFNKATTASFQAIESETKEAVSIASAYVHVLDLLTSLCQTYGEDQIFTGDPSLQLEAQAAGETAPKIMNMSDAVASLLAVSDQGGGCPVPGSEQLWPEVANISAGPLGGGLSHLARFSEIILGMCSLFLLLFASDVPCTGVVTFDLCLQNANTTPTTHLKGDLLERRCQWTGTVSTTSLPTQK